MEKTRIIIYIAVLAAVVGILWSFQTCQSAIQENRELHGKVDQLQYTLAHSEVQVKHDTIFDSIPVASQPAIIIDKTDYKKLEADKELIAALNLKISQVEAENRTLLATQGQVDFKSDADSDSVLRYHDRWVDFTYLIKPKSLVFSMRDSLTFILSRQYKHKFLWWRWGTKGHQIHVVSHNPNASVVYNRYIKVEK